MTTRKTILLATLLLAAAACGGGHGDLAPPSDLKVTIVSGGAHLTWKDNSSDEAQFMIERKVGGAAFQVLDSVPFDTTQYHDGKVTSGTSYTYRVMAMPKSGEAHGADVKYSNEALVTIP